MIRSSLSLAAALSLCSCVQPLSADAGPGAAEAGDPRPLTAQDGGAADSTADAGGFAAEDAGSAIADGGEREDDAGAISSDAGPLDASPLDAGPTDSDAGPEAADAGTSDADAGEVVLGTFDAPIVVDSFPSTMTGDTTVAPSAIADAYTPCAPSTNESGGEFVYVVQTPEDIAASILTVTVDDIPQDAIDIDLHLLDAPSPSACFERHNREVSVAVGPSETLYLAADTWTNGAGIPLEGAFVLSFSLSPVSVESCFENPAPQCTTAAVPTTLPIEAPGIGGCPAGMTPAGSVCVDVYEASLVEVRADGSLAPVSPFENPGNKVVRAVSAADVHPQGYISGAQAATACGNAGKRLCSETEWERACRGSTGRTYPYGNAREPGRCNDARTCHPALQYFESSADWVYSELDHPCINQLPSSLDTTGANAGCQSPDGAFDMMGNLHEWTATPSGVFRGGYYVDTHHNGDGCDYRTGAHNFTYSDYSTGFRCCADRP